MCTSAESLTFDGQDVPVVVELCVEEEALDERALAQPALAHHHQREVEASLQRLAVNLLGQTREAHRVVVVLQHTRTHVLMTSLK